MFYWATSFGFCLVWDISDVKFSAKMFSGSDGDICTAKPTFQPSFPPTLAPFESKSEPTGQPMRQATHQPPLAPFSTPSDAPLSRAISSSPPAPTTHPTHKTYGNFTNDNEVNSELTVSTSKSIMTQVGLSLVFLVVYFLYVKLTSCMQ
mmetsp:Transcript_5402/g.11125  ORF Transcript_5402/g.11125 Transcript_5402/m.11125 type:complete len:149 (+) Transcript_5402:698-1144(+)